MWLCLLLLLPVLLFLCLFVAARMRSAMRKYTLDLRTIAQQITFQTRQLSTIRHAANESRTQSTRRANQLTELQTNITHLTTSLSAMTNNRNQLQLLLDAAKQSCTDLSARLAASEARCARLETDLKNGSFVKWELLSKLHTDANHRLMAVNHLRHPCQQSISQISQLSSPTAVAKSPSHSFLLTLRPDLDVSDEEHDSVSDFDGIGIPFQHQPSYISSSSSNIASLSEPLSLHRTPWLDTLDPRLQSAENHDSIAVAVRPPLHHPALGLFAVSPITTQPQNNPS